MKRKITSLVLILALISATLLMTGCAPKPGDSVFETYCGGILKNMSQESPTSVEVYHDEAGMGYCFYMDSEDSQIAFDIADAFRSLTIAEEVSPDACEGAYYDITFNFESSESAMVSFNGSYLSYYDDNSDDFNVYRIEGCDVLEELILDALYSKFGEPVSYQTILDSNNVRLQLGDYYEDEDGDFIVEIMGHNETGKDICFKLNTSVNGYTIHSYQTFGLMADSNDVGYYAVITSSLLKAFGIQNIGEVKFTVDVFEEGEDGQRIVSTDEPIVLQTELYNQMDTELTLGTPLYEKNGLAIYGKRDEAETSTGLMLYYKNDSDKDRAVSFNTIKTDKKSIDVQSYNEYFTVPVGVGSSSFLYVPLYNFTWDESTGVTTKNEIKTLKVAFDIFDGNKAITTKEAVVK